MLRHAASLGCAARPPCGAAGRPITRAIGRAIQRATSFGLGMVCAFAAAIALPAGIAHGAEAIERYDATIEVRADGDLAVTETITVTCSPPAVPR